MQDLNLFHKRDEMYKRKGMSQKDIAKEQERIQNLVLEHMLTRQDPVKIAKHLMEKEIEKIHRQINIKRMSEIREIFKQLNIDDGMSVKEEDQVNCPNGLTEGLIRNPMLSQIMDNYREFTAFFQLNGETFTPNAEESLLKELSKLKVENEWLSETITENAGIPKATDKVYDVKILLLNTWNHGTLMNKILCYSQWIPMIEELAFVPNILVFNMVCKVLRWSEYFSDKRTSVQIREWWMIQELIYEQTPILELDEKAQKKKKKEEEKALKKKRKEKERQKHIERGLKREEAQRLKIEDRVQKKIRKMTSIKMISES